MWPPALPRCSLHPFSPGHLPPLPARLARHAAVACGRRLLLARAQELAGALAPLVQHECSALLQDMEKFVLAPLAATAPTERVAVRAPAGCAYSKRHF